jgi:aquaporin Z
MSLFAISFVEFIGTFIFISVILLFASKEWGAVAIGIALTAMILFGGAISGGHFNPAVSFAMYLSGNIEAFALCTYIVAQCLGGGCAHLYASSIATVVA